MIQQLIGSEVFWIVLSGLALIYYGVVCFLFFKSPIRTFFTGIGTRSNQESSHISIDELAFSLAIQRKRLLDKHAPLDAHEQELIAKSPFKELLGQLAN